MSATTAPAPGPTAAGTLYLTQMMVPHEHAVRVLRIRDSYDWHQRVWQAFSGRHGHSRDFLIRIDRLDDAFRVLILSQSPAGRPDWCPDDCFGTKRVPEDFLGHRRYRFSLLANPTKKLRMTAADGTRKKNGRRVPITQRVDLVRWLADKGDRGGFAIDADAVRIVPRGREHFLRGGSHGTHGAVEFQGELTVTDATLFHTTVSTGIGSAKAFGFGMLVITPVR